MDEWKHIDNATLFVLSGMIAKAKEMVLPLDWKHIFTTIIVAFGAAIAGSYVKVERIEERITQISTARTAQVKSIKEECDNDINSLKSYVQEREAATRSELVLVRETLAHVRESLAKLNGKLGK